MLDHPRDGATSAAAAAAVAPVGDLCAAAAAPRAVATPRHALLPTTRLHTPAAAPAVPPRVGAAWVGRPHNGGAAGEKPAERWRRQPVTAAAREPGGGGPPAVPPPTAAGVAAAGVAAAGAAGAAAAPSAAARDTDDPRSLAILTTVPLLWASYAVVARAVLTSDALPLPLAVVNLGAYAVATVGLLGLLAAGVGRGAPLPSPLKPDTSSAASEATTVSGETVYQSIATATAPTTPLATETPTAVPPLPPFGLVRTVLVAAELGAYLFAGSTLQLVGLTTTPAARATFLVQTTTVMVPLFEATALRRRLPPRLWASVGVSAVAITLFTGLPSLPLAPGDAASLGAAVAYSAHVLRLSALAGRLPSALPLAAAKAGVQALYAAAYAVAVLGGVPALAATLSDVAAAVVARVPTAIDTATTIATSATAATAATAATTATGSGGDGASAPVVLAGVVWMGLAGTAAATWAQVEGQRGVRPAAAGVIYAGQPAAAAAAAALVLGEGLSATQVAAVVLTLARTAARRLAGRSTRYVGRAAAHRPAAAAMG
ncbi:hypothetical protein MMPV_007178 [Pyropia vietnamensis]